MAKAKTDEVKELRKLLDREIERSAFFEQAFRTQMNENAELRKMIEMNDERVNRQLVKERDMWRHMHASLSYTYRDLLEGYPYKVVAYKHKEQAVSEATKVMLDRVADRYTHSDPITRRVQLALHRSHFWHLSAAARRYEEGDEFEKHTGVFDTFERKVII